MKMSETLGVLLICGLLSLVANVVGTKFGFFEAIPGFFYRIHGVKTIPEGGEEALRIYVIWLLNYGLLQKIIVLGGLVIVYLLRDCKTLKHGLGRAVTARAM